MKTHLNGKLVLYSSPWIAIMFAFLIWVAHWISDLLIEFAKAVLETASRIFHILVPEYPEWAPYVPLLLFMAFYIYLFWASCRAVGLRPTMSKIQLGARLIYDFAHGTLEIVETPFKLIYIWIRDNIKGLSDLIDDSEPIE